MFKGILLILIITSCGSIGIFKSMSYSKRLKELNLILDTLLIINTEISYMLDPLPVIFRRVSAQKDNIASDILKKCDYYMSKNMPISQCWQKAVNEVCENSCLNTADKAVIGDLGTSLGKSGITGQTRLFELTQEKIKHRIHDAEKEKVTKGKMYSGLGFSIGFVVAVLFI